MGAAFLFDAASIQRSANPDEPARMFDVSYPSKTFLSFHDVNYFFCRTGSLCIEQLKPSVDKRNGSPDGLTPLDLR